MKFNPRVLVIANEQIARQELLKLGCDPTGINIMSGKAVFKTIKLEDLPAKAANLLKQTFLAKGGEVAVARGSADLAIERTDVIICATLKQYRLALAQLKLQPWGLPAVASAIESELAAGESLPKREYVWDDKCLSLIPGRTLIMGILNLTPDSFSDGGQFSSLDNALRHAQQMIDDGADILDIGAESTRPYGAEKVSAAEEMGRLLPVLEKVLAFSPVPVSIDTYKAEVAEAALKIGAHIVNDIWGLQYDPAMAETVAKYQVPVVAMHNQQGTEYAGDIMASICRFLRGSLTVGRAAGILPHNIWIDPGIGFGKTPAQNLTVMARLHELKGLGCPILLGTSRKRFIGQALGNLPPDDRLEGTAATVAVGVMNGAQIIRVHDVKAMARVAKVTDSILQEAFIHE